MIELTNTDRAAIDRCYADNGWDISDQLSEYRLCEANYRAGLAAGIERAAKVCDRYEQHKWHIYKDGDGDLRADPHIQGQADGAADCSAAIRALNAPAAP